MISIRNLTVSYGETQVLDRVNLEVSDRDFVGIIGPNGAGKSTLLKAILGLIKPDSGEVVFTGPATIGYVPQLVHFENRFPIRVRDVVLSGALDPPIRPFHRYGKIERSMAEKWMKSLGIDQLARRLMHQLSGGQKQKVLIARALMRKPDILVLDEPTASIDASSRTEIFEILKTLNEDMAILLVSHDVGVISSYVKRIACMNIQLIDHNEPELDHDTIEKIYGCPVDLISHGDVPHRVLHVHEHAHKGGHSS